MRRTEKKLKLYHGALSFCFVIVLGFITMNQLTNDPDVYASVDLYSYQEMDEETEELLSVFDGEVEITFGATVSIVNELIVSVTESFDALSLTVIVQSV